MTYRALDDDQRDITAEHEAAHVVAYIAYGHPIHHVEIWPDAVTRSSPAPVLRPLWDLAVISIAGVVIEDRYVHRPLAERVAEVIEWIDMGEEPDGGDMDLFAHHPELAEVAYNVAKDLLERYAEVHAEITEALMTSPGYLTGDEVAALPLAGALMREMQR